MATPNYAYEKRQRELAKKKKAEEKRLRKQQRSDEAPKPEPIGTPTDVSAATPQVPGSER